MATTIMPTSTIAATASGTRTATASATCVTMTPGKYGYVDPTACNAQYEYNPSFAAALLFAVIFAIVTAAHLTQAFIYKKRYTWVLIMGAAWEFGSFAVRVVSTRHQQNQTMVIVSQLLLLLAPLWINAFAYMTLGRLIHYFHPRQRVYGVKAASVAKYFVWCDVISFLVQATGGSMLSPGESASSIKLGLHIYMGGVGLQEAFIVVFAILSIKFQKDMLDLERQRRHRPERNNWRVPVYTMYAVLLLITIRIIYRLIEYSRGLASNNPIPFHEAYVYALDATPMFIAIALLNIFHPGKVLVGPESEFPKLTRREKKELKRQRKAERINRKNGKSGSEELIMLQQV